MGQPIIEVVDARFRGRDELLLSHLYEGTELDHSYTRPTLKNLYAIWKRPVHIHTRRKGKRDDSSQGVLVSYDGSQHHEEPLELE